MFCYALVIVGVPRLRVRLDQAGDNAYYLGLLFTLASMAYALYQFGGVVVSGATASGRTGAQQIIANFGIALASTVAGIFLRVLLQQMRIDPAEVEQATRLELAEAARRVRATLNTVTMDLGRFHDEVRQRSLDVLTSLFEDSRKALAELVQEAQRTLGEAVASAAATQREVLERTQDGVRLLAELIAEVGAAIERLREVQPPPLLLSRRMDRLAQVLESGADQAGRIVSRFQAMAEAGDAATGSLARAGDAMEQLTSSITVSHEEAVRHVSGAVRSVNEALEGVARALAQDLQALKQLEQQSVTSMDAAARAQTASIEVLGRLTELTRGLAHALRLRERVVGDGRSG
jgi:hypothetical protein